MIGWRNARIRKVRAFPVEWWRFSEVSLLTALMQSGLRIVEKN